MWAVKVGKRRKPNMAFNGYNKSRFTRCTFSVFSVWVSLLVINVRFATSLSWGTLITLNSPNSVNCSTGTVSCVRSSCSFSSHFESLPELGHATHSVHCNHFIVLQCHANVIFFIRILILIKICRLTNQNKENTTFYTLERLYSTFSIHSICVQFPFSIFALLCIGWVGRILCIPLRSVYFAHSTLWLSLCNIHYIECTFNLVDAMPFWMWNLFASAFWWPNFGSQLNINTSEWCGNVEMSLSWDYITRTSHLPGECFSTLLCGRDTIGLSEQSQLPLPLAICPSIWLTSWWAGERLRCMRCVSEADFSLSHVKDWLDRKLQWKKILCLGMHI